MRNQFDEQMGHLHAMMLEMGALCESAIASATKAILENDEANGARAIALEEEINKRESEIETQCLTLLLRQQPVAKDLRQISSVLKMVTDMERIGDQAADIAEVARFCRLPAGGETFSIKEMALAAIKMVSNSIDAYVRQDLALAARVIEADDEVDRLFSVAKRDLAQLLAKHPEQAEGVLDLLMIAKYLERIADHAVNIGEWVIFAVTGAHQVPEEVGKAQ